MEHSKASTGRRRFPMGFVKRAAAGVTSALLNGLCAAGGTGAQPLYTPVLAWMLGLGRQRAAGFALPCTAAAAIGVALGAAAGGTALAGWAGAALLLVICATIGALIAIATVRGLDDRFRMPAGALMVVAGLVYLHRPGDLLRIVSMVPTVYHGPPLHGLPLVLLGLIVGFVTQALAIPGSAAMPFALIVFAGFQPIGAIMTATFAVGLAALLPSMRVRFVDRDAVRLFRVSTAGAVVGGLFAGWVVPGLRGVQVIEFLEVSAILLAAGQIIESAQRDFDQNSSPAPNGK